MINRFCNEMEWIIWESRKGSCFLQQIAQCRCILREFHIIHTIDNLSKVYEWHTYKMQIRILPATIIEAVGRTPRSMSGNDFIKKTTCPNPSFPSFFQVGCSVLHVVKTYFLISTYIWMLCEGAYLQVRAILDGKLLLCKYHWYYVYLFPAAVEVHLGCEALADLHPGGLGMDPPGRRHRPLHRGKNENGG